MFAPRKFRGAEVESLPRDGYGLTSWEILPGVTFSAPGCISDRPAGLDKVAGLGGVADLRCEPRGVRLADRCGCHRHDGRAEGSTERKRNLAHGPIVAAGFCGGQVKVGPRLGVRGATGVGDERPRLRAEPHQARSRTRRRHHLVGRTRRQRRRGNRVQAPPLQAAPSWRGPSRLPNNAATSRGPRRRLSPKPPPWPANHVEAGWPV